MTCLWLSNHPCSKEQQQDVITLFDSAPIELNAEGKKMWGQIDPDSNFGEIVELADQVIQSTNLLWSEIDGIVIMGELSICVAMVAMATIHGVKVATPTTQRESVETISDDGSVTKTNVFRHCQLRVLHDPELSGNITNEITNL